MEKSYCKQDYLDIKAAILRRAQLQLCKEQSYMEQLLRRYGTKYAEHLFKHKAPIEHELIYYKKKNKLGIDPQYCTTNPMQDRLKDIIHNDCCELGRKTEKKVDAYYDAKFKKAMQLCLEFEKFEGDLRINYAAYRQDDLHTRRLQLIFGKFKEKFAFEIDRYERYFQTQSYLISQKCIQHCNERVKKLRLLYNIHEDSDEDDDIPVTPGVLPQPSKLKNCPTIYVAKDDKETQWEEEPIPIDLKDLEKYTKLSNAQNLCELIQFMAVKDNEHSKILSGIELVYVNSFKKLNKTLQKMIKEINICQCHRSLYSEIEDLIQCGVHKIRNLQKENKKFMYNFLRTSGEILPDEIAGELFCPCDLVSSDDDSWIEKCKCPNPKCGKCKRRAAEQLKEKSTSLTEDDPFDGCLSLKSSTSSPAEPQVETPCQRSSSISEDLDINLILAITKEKLENSVDINSIIEVLKVHFKMSPNCLNTLANEVYYLFKGKISGIIEEFNFRMFPLNVQELNNWKIDYMKFYEPDLVDKRSRFPSYMKPPKDKLPVFPLKKAGFIYREMTCEQWEAILENTAEDGSDKSVSDVVIQVPDPQSSSSQATSSKSSIK